LHTLQGRLLKVIQAEGAGQTLMGLAHEINQPLAAIAAYNQACLRMAETETGMRAEIVAAIKATADNAVLAGDIIRKFRSVVAATQVTRTPLSLQKVIQDSVEIARSRIRSEEIRMVISVGTELPEILGDATLIKQVILNLIGNAADAMTSVQERTLIIVARKAGSDKIRVEISDSGPGVREELRDRIFDPYFTTKAGGLGMGLAISKAIMEAHGESIGCEARLEGGTTFWFTLGVGSD
jgi:C4-dicarboxylate-specific signal transduction histidine kinase